MAWGLGSKLWKVDYPAISFKELKSLDIGSQGFGWVVLRLETVQLACGMNSRFVEEEQAILWTLWVRKRAQKVVLQIGSVCLLQHNAENVDVKEKLSILSTEIPLVLESNDRSCWFHQEF